MHGVRQEEEWEGINLCIWFESNVLKLANEPWLKWHFSHKRGRRVRLWVQNPLSAYMTYQLYLYYVLVTNIAFISYCNRFLRPLVLWSLRRHLATVFCERFLFIEWIKRTLMALDCINIFIDHCQDSECMKVFTIYFLFILPLCVCGWIEMQVWLVHKLFWYSACSIG